MSELTKPIPSASLAPEVSKALSGPMKTMAARGLVPLAEPGDLLTLLFQLSTDADPSTRAAATKTARELPENVTAGALASEDLFPNVLHFFAAISTRDSDAAQRIILNQRTADETIAEVSRRATEAEANLIVANEERLLRHPAIIGSLYVNPNALQSIIDRAIELAIRNNVRVPGIAAWDELAHELMTSGQSEEVEVVEADLLERGALDQMVRRYMSLSDDEVVPNPQSIHDLRITTQMRLAMIGPSMLRSVLLRSRKSAISMAAIKSPKVTEADAAKYAGNLSLGEEVIRYIATRREWTKNYSVKAALIKNPKCPMPSAMKLMPFLRERDLTNLTRSKNIPSALRAQARKLSIQRKGGRKPSR